MGADDNAAGGRICCARLKYHDWPLHMCIVRSSVHTGRLCELPLPVRLLRRIVLCNRHDSKVWKGGMVEKALRAPLKE
jgi:hypothetical protein